MMRRALGRSKVWGVRRAGIRTALLALGGWTLLVVCRVAARLVSVGTGTRTVVGLTALTASVNAYWLLAGPVLAVLRRLAASRGTRPRTIGVIGFAAAAAVCGEPLWYARALRVFHGAPLPWREALLSRADVNILVVALILAAGWLGDDVSRALARQRQRGTLESTLADGELRALMLQLQPHFLFNTLQLAAEAAYDDIAAGRRIVRDLHALLRHTFEFEERSLVRATEEIDFLQSYLGIQRRRFGTRLSVVLRVDPRTQTLMLPPLLLQPLVENSIQHGIGPLARDGRVHVDVQRDGATLRIAVRDNGIGFGAARDQGASSGLGLGVTRRRLAALFPGRHRIDVGDAPGGGALVTVVIPAIDADAATIAQPAPAREQDDAAGDPALGARSWTSAAVVAILLGAVLGVANVVVTALRRDGTATIGSPVSVPIAMRIPVQAVFVALAVVLWHARDVRRWLQQRDSETRALDERIAATRACADALRSSKGLMLSALDRLVSAPTAADFDERVVGASALIRSLLASSAAGSASSTYFPSAR